MWDNPRTPLLRYRVFCGALVVSLVGGMLATVMICLAPSLFEVCQSASEESACVLAMSSDSHSSVPGNSRLASVPLSRALASQIVLKNTNSSGTVIIDILGYQSANPATDGSFTRPLKSSVVTSFKVGQDSDVAVVLPFAPAAASRVLIRLKRVTPRASCAGPSKTASKRCSGVTVSLSVDLAPLSRTEVVDLKKLAVSSPPTVLPDAMLSQTVAGARNQSATPRPPTAMNVGSRSGDHPPASVPAVPVPSAGSSIGASRSPSPTRTSVEIPSAAPVRNRPGPSNTGVPAGVILTQRQGNLRITTAGTVVDGIDLHGRVWIDAPNVTIKNSIIRGEDGGWTGSSGLINNTGHQAGLIVEDSELIPTVLTGWVNGILGSDFTANRLDVVNVIDSIHINGDNVSVTNSWLHDNTHLTSDPNQNGTPSHDDSIQIERGHHLYFAGNSLSGAFNSGVQITQGLGSVADVRFSDNFADGGGCTFNISETRAGPIQSVVITNNRFGRNTKVVDCAIVSPPSTVVIVSDNYFTDGAVVGITRGI